MKTVFLGERATVATGSVVSMGANAYSPPDESVGAYNYFKDEKASQLSSWLEMWDYEGGCSFRGFVAGNRDERCLFAFFNSGMVGRDLKQGLMALIELASSPFQCSQVVICLDLSIEPEQRRSLLKSLRWVGFELIALDMWAKQEAMTSDKWLFLGMEL